LEALEEERMSIQKEREGLLAEHNQESEQWKQRYREMTKKNDEIMENLAEANQCYFNQVTENEKLSKQISELQAQHRDLVLRFEQVQQQLANKDQEIREQQQKLSAESSRYDKLQQENKTLSETMANFAESSSRNEKAVKQAFDSHQLVSLGEEGAAQAGVRKIQEMLLDSEDVNGASMSESMVAHY
jgi:chromosome segregation ATPase